MKSEAIAATTATHVVVPSYAPKEPKTATITLTANGQHALTLRAHRLSEGSESFVTTTEGKTTTRGMTIHHTSWDYAKAWIASARDQGGATRLGEEAPRAWVRRSARRL